MQLPAVLRLDREIRLSTGRDEPAFKEAVRKAGPAILGRGVVQLSGYLDLVLASLLAIGAVARLRYAQTLYLLPISLFGMSVAAAELPELARERDGAIGALRERTVAAVRRVAFFVVPSFVAFVALGDVLVAGLYRAGEFGAADVAVVWLILIGYSFGLLASTTTRIYQSAFFALRDTATPARVGVRARARRARRGRRADGAVRARHGARRSRFRPACSRRSTRRACRSVRSGSRWAPRSARGSSGRC